MKTKIPIYLDYMATTPVDPRVAKVMQRSLTIDGNFGNPASSTHSFGWRAKEAVDIAREQVANSINAQVNEIIFTSGATEANNLALIGAANFYQRNGKHIITVKTEHQAVLDVCRHLASQGFEITYLDVDKSGLLSPDVLRGAIRSDTILVSVMHVNNEIGVVQNIADLAKITRKNGTIFHCDGAQSMGKVKVDVEQLGVDLYSMSAHKAYGPKGIGALFVRRQPRVRLTPLLFGGGHEQTLRSGTLATHQIVGMGEAFMIANNEMQSDVERITVLRNKLLAAVNAIDESVIHGDLQHRVANNLNVGFGYVDGDSLLVALKDIAVSSGSACTSATIEPSHVLLALGVSESLAHSSMRFSLGRFTTIDDIDYAIEHITKQVGWLRNLSPLWDQYLASKEV